MPRFPGSRRFGLAERLPARGDVVLIAPGALLIPDVPVWPSDAYQHTAGASI